VDPRRLRRAHDGDASKAAKTFRPRLTTLQAARRRHQDLPPKAQDFEAGKVTPADFKEFRRPGLAEFVKARDAVAKLEKYKARGGQPVRFVDAADLYWSTRI